MSYSRLCWSLLVGTVLGACAAPADETRAAAGGYKAVLIAGDASLPVFDNAVSGVGTRLLTLGGIDQADIRRLSASPSVAEAATPDNILNAIASMRPKAGQSCFVYATSHGAEGFGFVLGLTDEFISPQDLDAALLRGCRGVPTVVVISACFSGIYARPPMTRPNRIVLTAARPDRTSFGCHAGREYTVYDKCLLAAFDAGGSWKQAYASIRQCVGLEERREHVLPSEPQAWFGPMVANMALPVRAVGSP
jgi:hypothetical protein